MTNSADPDQLGLHCLLRQGTSCSAREGLTINLPNLNNSRRYFIFLPENKKTNRRIYQILFSGQNKKPIRNLLVSDLTSEDLTNGILQVIFYSVNKWP